MNRISKEWKEIQDGIKFNIDEAGCLWVDASGGRRTGFMREGNKLIGLYLTKQQLEQMRLQHEK